MSKNTIWVCAFALGVVSGPGIGGFFGIAGSFVYLFPTGHAGFWGESVWWHVAAIPVGMLLACTCLTICCRVTNTPLQQCMRAFSEPN